MMLPQVMRNPAIGVVVLAIACSEPAAVEPVSLSVEPGGSERVIRIGSIEQLTAHARADNSADLGVVAASWISSDTTIAKVSATGELRLASSYSNCRWAYPGECRVDITARSGSLAGKQTLVVIPYEPTMMLNTMNLYMEMGDSTQISATMQLETRAVDWCTLSFATRDSAVAQVSATGMVTAYDSGSTYVEVHARGPLCPAAPAQIEVNTFSRLHTLMIEPGPEVDVVAGSDVKLTAIVRNFKGVVYPAISPRWESADTMVASVDANGVVRARSCTASCRTTITARTGRLSATAIIRVK